MCSIKQKENNICRSYGLRDGTLHRFCINRFCDNAGNSIYLDTGRKCNDIFCDDCDDVWISDIFLHNHSQSTKNCQRCCELKKVYLAQCEFILTTGLQMMSNQGAKDRYWIHRANSSIFGGSPRTFYRGLTWCNDSPEKVTAMNTGK